LTQLMTEFVSLGGRVVDSSPMYGSSETVVGAVAKREQLFVATKVWTRGRAAGLAQMEDSLRKLRADPIDLMQVHNLVDVEVHLETLREWKRQGRVRYLGVTHYHTSGHTALARVMEGQLLDFVQLNYSVAEREVEQRLLPLARERGLAVIVNRPFQSGALLQRLSGRPLPPWAAELGCQSWAQLLLKWVVAHPAVTCAIPATSKLTHLRDNMAAGHGPMPSTQQRKLIAQSWG
jgi:aryl-alcohol dehydrogenase-like predicted oxidoreductase